MPFVHHRWEKNGRLLRDDVDPIKFRWSSTVSDDENVDNGDGTFSPYVWDAGTGVAKFGRSEFDISAGGLLKFAGIERSNKFDYVLEADFGSGFVEANMGGVPTLLATENDDHLLLDLTFTNCRFRWQDVPGRTSQDGDLFVDYKAQLRVQSGNTLTLAQYITSPEAMTVRVKLEVGGLPLDAATDYTVRRKNANWTLATRRDEASYDLDTLGVFIGDFRLLWSDDEKAVRSVSTAQQGQKQTLTVLMGPYTLLPNIETVIFPDQFAGGDVAAANDGTEYDSTWEVASGDGDGMPITADLADTTGNRADSDTGGLRWTGLPSNIADATSVDTGTKILFDCQFTNGSPDCRIYTIEDTNPAVFSDSNLMIDEQPWGGFGVVNVPDGGADDIDCNMTTPLETFRDTGAGFTNSGAIAFAVIVADSTSKNFYMQKAETAAAAGQSPARLTIEYTVSSGVSIPLVMNDHRMRRNS